MTRIAGRFALLATVLLVGTAPGQAEDEMTGSEIKTLFSGNTATGAMVDTGSYTEFYQADGVIKGDGYTGAWSVSDDSMCFRYGSDPRKCWQVREAGNGIQWINGRKVDGTGTILPGNPNNY